MKKLLLLITCLFFFNLAHAQIQGYSVGDTVDDFTITTIDGEEINLYTITAGGQYVYIDFFFVDCGPCQNTAPHFNQFHDAYGCNEGDVFCMSVNTGQDDDAYVESYETNYGGDYSPCPISSGDGGSAVVDNDFNPAAYPTICLISPDNVLLNGDIWPISSYSDFADALVDEGFTPELMECTALSVKEIESKEAFSVYPNPASDHITISADGSIIQAIEMFNSIGNKVYQVRANASANTVNVDVSGLDAGIYIVNIYDENNVKSSERINVIR
jgi:thiol-disulfide isomerase/thioredoxin